MKKNQKEKEVVVKSSNNIVLGGIYDKRADRYVHIGAYTNDDTLTRAFVAMVAYNPDKTYCEFTSDYEIHRLAIIDSGVGEVTPCYINIGRVDVLKKQIEKVS